MMGRTDRFFFIDSVLGNGKLRRHRLLCRYVDRSEYTSAVASECQSACFKQNFAIPKSKKDSFKVTTDVVSFRNLENIYTEPWIDFEGQQNGDELCNQTPPS